jgi:phospholipid/cholesterol/gamma-HCH transport system substrate-binding protein
VNRLRARVARALLLAVVGALALTGCDFSVYSIPLPGGADLGDNPYTVKVEFRDVLDLVPQSSVKVDDVTVGKVSDIQVRGSHAEVSLQLRRSVKLPDNAEAKIRQTSLLGEKFVSLAPPPTGATGRLGNGDVIPLSRSGRNPEVEEVLGALSLLLNGGGVAQLKMISSELNKALGGREPDVRSVLTQLKVFMGRLDTNKDQIVAAIRSLNHLAVSLNKQKSSITLALDQLPRAVASINRQRDDLVKMLRALSDLSAVGTRVIDQSKTATVDSLRALAPTLTKLAEAGDSLPKALQVFLTYPFVDAVVGTNPAEARNLHMGDYTNLSIKLKIDLSDLGLGQLCTTLPQLKDVPLNICNNPDLVSCATQLLGTDPGNLPASLVEALQTVLDKCTKGAIETICSGSLGPQIPLCSFLNGLPIKPPDLPLKVPSLSALQKCLASGKPLGAACDKLDPLALVQHCAPTSKKNKPSGYYSETCKRYRQLNLGITKNGVLGQLPILGGGSGGGSGGGGNGGGGGLLGGGGRGGLPGLGRAGFGPAASHSPGTAAHADRVGDLGAMLVWGMVQR